MHIMKGEDCMKHLKIDSGEATYSVDGENYKELHNLSKDDLLEIMNSIYNLEVDGFENIADRNNSTIKNPADMIVYDNIFSKLEQFFDNREILRQEIDELFSETENSI